MNESVDRVRRVLAELVKAALVSDDAASLRYREAARAARDALTSDPPRADAVRVDGAWTLAVHDVEVPELSAEQGQVNLTLPRACPFTLDELNGPGLDVDEAVARIREAASTG